MSKRNEQFQTIRTEGGLLPPDVITRISAHEVNGTTPESYHLPPGTKLNEAISQSWAKLKTYWSAFQESREKSAGGHGTAVTNERWLLPLFQELGYGRLTTVKSPEIEGRSYPIQRFWNHVPIHLLGCELSLDRRTRGAKGAATSSPHSMVQEFLNRSDDYLWAFLSNGLQLRILRDNVSLSRQAYIEFDLEAMFEGEVYADFAILWMITHESRVEAEKPEDCYLEKWSKLARELGTRVLADLRNGVTKAIEQLGTGFISHPKNDHLRDKLRTGQVSKEDYYRQLLRVVYRLLFLFVAEDRELLHSPDADTEASKLYQENYSTSRLRELSRAFRGSKHSDLWYGLSLVFAALGRDDGCRPLGLTPFGSFLWRPNSTRDLNGPLPPSFQHDQQQQPSLISNDDLLAAVRTLGFVVQNHVLRGVDYRNLGSEELGSVYESLLEMHPHVNIPAKTFELRIAAGSERKTTGSYYTPDSLVQCLLDSALEPVVEERIRNKRGADAESAILDMKVCDPACGSGHFLIAAAHRLARHLARARTGELEPSPADHQHALRDVIGRCIYGVDINPMAVELCKVSLWMEAIEPGKPLSFLDHHIQCGNSLLGTTPALLAEGIPEDAFKPIEGDVKTICSELKADNKRQLREYASGQKMLFDLPYKLGNLPATFAQLSTDEDESVSDIADKERRYAELVGGANYMNARLLADTWCAVFVWKKDTSDLGKMCPTERDFRKIENNPHSILPHVKLEVQRLADQYQFFHWHLAFPDVFRLPEEAGRAENEQTGWSRGFDVALGNPPWERVKLQEKEWFAERAPKVANAANSSKRKKLIEALKSEEPELFKDFLGAKRLAEGEGHLLRDSGAFPLCGRGDVNTYAIFSELNTRLLSKKGSAGFIVQSDIGTGETYQKFFNEILAKNQLVSFFDFVNTEGIFPGIHRTHPHFCLMTLSKFSRRGPAVFAFWNTNVAHLLDEDRHFRLTASDLKLLNPATGTCPVFRSKRDAELNRHVYRRCPVLAHSLDSVGTWAPQYLRLVDYGDHSELLSAGISTEALIGQTPKRYPIWESKLLHQFNHRYATYFDVGTSAERVDILGENQLVDPSFYITTRFSVTSDFFTELVAKPGYSRAWFLAYRDITNTTNERTTIATAIPFCPAARSSPVLGYDPKQCGACLLANLNSLAFDYLARLKLGGTHMTYSTLTQLPVIPPEFNNQLHQFEEFITARVLELTYTAWDLEAFALDCGYDGPPFRWDEERRFLLRCELDSAYFHLYLGSPSEWGADSPQLPEMFSTPRDAVDYIMETFPIVKRKDIARTAVKSAAGKVINKGRYITKDRILEIYDEMAESIRTGEPYQTRLDPPPADPRLAHPPRKRQLAYGYVAADILLLLREWNSAVSILALEPGVLLMQNEDARLTFLGHVQTPATAANIQGSYRVIEGIDLVYQGLVTNGAIEPVGQNGYRLLKPELIADLSAENLQRAKDVVEAITRLDRPEDAMAIVAEVTHERYTVAFS